MPVVVEFNGIPGVGKTTIARRVEQILRNKGLKVFTVAGLRWDTFYNKVRLLIDLDAWCFCYYLSQTLGVKYWLPTKYFFAAARMYVAIRDFIIKSSDNDVLLLDQGIIQILCAVGGIKQRQMYNYRIVFNYLGKKNIYIFRIDCDNNINLAETRIDYRNQKCGRFDRLSGQERHDAYILWSKRLDLLRTQSRIISKSDIAVDCSISPDQNAMTISKMILNIYY